MGRPSTSDYLLATGRPDDLAVVDSGRRYTYRDLRASVARLATELTALDLPPGARIGVIGANSYFWIAAYLAAMRTHVAVPFADKLTPDEIGRQSAWVGCAAVLMDRRHRRRFADAFPADLPILTDEALTPTAHPDELDVTDVDPDADAALVFTSGTTSEPKAVRITHRNIQANTDAIITYLGLHAADRMLVVLPFHYCFGASLLHTHLRTGASLVLCSTFTFPETAVDLLDREACPGIAGVPSTYQLLLRASTFATRPLASLRHVQQAGGKLPDVLIEQLVAAQPGARVFVMYGQTEATARLSYLPPEKVLDKLGSIGNGIPGVELRVVDDTGAQVAPGEIGEIVARGDSISPGYYRDPTGTAQKFTDGALRTGDLATVDADGDIVVVDRKDDFIKSWGYRVSSHDIEACALQLPELVSAAAVGVPDLNAGEAIALAVTVRPGAELAADDVLAFVRSRLAKHMVPTSVHLVASLPLTANGKVSKVMLRELVTARMTPHADGPV